MDRRIADHILKWHYESDLNFIKLLSFIDDNNIPVVDSKLISAVGMATYYKIHLDLDSLDFQPPSLRYFIILHEIGHYKRLQKKGLEYHLHKLSSTNVNILYNHILNEEIIADKYGMFTFKRLTGVEYPYEMTQQLKDYENKVKFIDTAYSLIGKLNGTEDSYKIMIQQYIIR
jgi:hypothetical protein